MSALYAANISVFIAVLFVRPRFCLRKGDGPLAVLPAGPALYALRGALKSSLLEFCFPDGCGSGAVGSGALSAKALDCVVKDLTSELLFSECTRKEYGKTVVYRLDKGMYCSQWCSGCTILSGLCTFCTAGFEHCARYTTWSSAYVTLQREQT